MKFMPLSTNDELSAATPATTKPAPHSWQMAANSRQPLLSVNGLVVEFETPRGRVKAVDGVSWDVAPGEIVALVGESGCGKSVTALSILQLLPVPAARIVAGSLTFDGEDLLEVGPARMRSLRGRAIAMVFQEPMTSLNPVLTIGQQIAEPLIQHLELSQRAARERSLELLSEVGITDAEHRLGQYPHQLSGGMRQRVMIAIGLSCRPKLLIADEPTTALDVTVQAQILELMKNLARRHGIALVLITHNLGIVARHVDRVNVMYAGRVVERGTVKELFARPLHPYTKGLLAAVPRLDEPRRQRMATIEGLPPDLSLPLEGCRFAPRCGWRRPECAVDPKLLPHGPRGEEVACHRAKEIALGAAPDMSQHADVASTAPLRVSQGTRKLLSLKALHKRFDLAHGRSVQAVQDVSFEVGPGETVGLVGESGCGKSTVGRMILRLTDATSGDIRFGDISVRAASGRALRDYRREAQVVFQDPYSSLNPRMTVGQILAEPIQVHRLAPRRDIPGRVASLLDRVGLPSRMFERYPHQLSGGQRQRVGIARALAMEPSFIVLDEPVSALDVCVQGQIVNLLADLQAQLGLSYLFIAHDLAVVRHLSHRVIVMYLGRVMETGSRDALYAEPLHPYTLALLDAAPVPDPGIEARAARTPLRGELPSPLAPPPGCVFSSRCPRASEACTTIVPPLREVRPGRLVACIKVQPC